MVSIPQARNSGAQFRPRIMSGFLDKDYQYGIHITLDADAVAFRWHQPTDTYETIVLSTVADNHLDLPLYFPNDGHYNLAIGVDDQDNVWISGNHRPTGFINPTSTHLLRCTNVEDFTNPASWDGSSTDHHYDLSTIPNPRNYCYHLFERMTDGTLLHFPSQMRPMEETWSSIGNRCWLGFKRRAGAWSPIVSDGTFGLADFDNYGIQRIYVSNVLVEARPEGDRVHVSGTWRDGDHAENQKWFWYIYSDHPDLTQWRYLTVDEPGSAIQPMPLDPTNMELSLITSAPHWSANSRLSLYIEDDGTPSIFVSVENTSDIHRCFWQEGWQSELVTERKGSEIRFKGQKYGQSNGPGRLGLRNQSNDLVMLGPQIATLYDYRPDPVWLRERDVYAVVIGETDTPIVWTIGDGSKRGI